MNGFSEGSFTISCLQENAIAFKELEVMFVKDKKTCTEINRIVSLVPAYKQYKFVLFENNKSYHFLPKFSSDGFRRNNRGNWGTIEFSYWTKVKK